MFSNFYCTVKCLDVRFHLLVSFNVFSFSKWTRHNISLLWHSYFSPCFVCLVNAIFIIQHICNLCLLISFSLLISLFLSSPERRVACAFTNYRMYRSHWTSSNIDRYSEPEHLISHYVFLPLGLLFIIRDIIQKNPTM